MMILKIRYDHTITIEQSERSFYYQSPISRLDDIQTTLIPLKKFGKNLNLNRLIGPTRPDLTQP